MINSIIFILLDALNRHLRSDTGTCSGNSRSQRTRASNVPKETPSSSTGSNNDTSHSHSHSHSHHHAHGESNGNGSSSSGSNGSNGNGNSSGYQASGSNSNGSTSNGNGHSSSSSNGKGNGNGDSHAHDPYRMIPNPNPNVIGENGGSSSNGSHGNGSGESNNEFPGLGLAGRQLSQLHQMDSSNDTSGNGSSSGNGNGNYHRQGVLMSRDSEKVMDRTREGGGVGLAGMDDPWRELDGEWETEGGRERYFEHDGVDGEYFADDASSVTDIRSLKAGTQFGYLPQPHSRYHHSHHHHNRGPQQHYHSHSHSHSHSHHHYGYPYQVQPTAANRYPDRAINSNTSLSNSSHTASSNQSAQIYPQSHYHDFPSPATSAQTIAVASRMPPLPPSAGAANFPIAPPPYKDNQLESPPNDSTVSAYPTRRQRYPNMPLNLAEGLF